MPTLSDRVSDALGQAVIAALAGLVGAVIYLWADNSALSSRLVGVEQDYTRLSSDIREFCQSGKNFTTADGKELRSEFIACRTRLQEQLNDISSSPSRFEPEGRQIKSALDDFREVQKDVLHRLRIIEGSVRAIHIMQGMQGMQGKSNLNPSVVPKTRTYN